GPVYLSKPAWHHGHLSLRSPLHSRYARGQPRFTPASRPPDRRTRGVRPRIRRLRIRAATAAARPHRPAPAEAGTDITPDENGEDSRSRRAPDENGSTKPASGLPKIALTAPLIRNIDLSSFIAPCPMKFTSLTHYVFYSMSDG